MVYETPEEGSRRLISRYYSGVNKVEIVRADKEIFDDLWFIEACVWADSCFDGKGFSGRDYDNPGWSFLRVQNGWVFIPEGKFPEMVAFSKWLFGLIG